MHLSDSVPPACLTFLVLRLNCGLKMNWLNRQINCQKNYSLQLLIFYHLVPKSAHITPFLYDLHWLPISSWIQYKIAFICFHIVSCTAPAYLPKLLHLYSPSCSLRSAADTSSVFLGWAGGPWGRDPFSTLDLCSGTPSLCQVFVFTLLSQN